MHVRRDALTGLLLVLPGATSPRISVFAARCIRHIDAQQSLYHFEGSGIQFVASLRHADLLVRIGITGPRAVRLLPAAISPRVSGGCSRERLQRPGYRLRANARHRRQQCCRRATGQAARARRLCGRHRRQLPGGAHCSACQTLRINDLRRRPEPVELRVYCSTSQASASNLDDHDLLARAARHARAILALLRRCTDRHSLFHGGSGIALDGVLAALTPTLTWQTARTAHALDVTGVRDRTPQARLPPRASDKPVRAFG